MSVQLRHSMSCMRDQIAAEGDLVAAAIARSFASFQELDLDMAREVIAGDDRIDRAEVDLEQALYRLLALHHPVACDLRFVLGALKINQLLERMGDLAKNIARCVTELPARPEPVELPADFRMLADEVQQIARASLECFQQDDSRRARRIVASIYQVENLRRSIDERLHRQIISAPSNAAYLLRLVSIARHFSRLANMAKHIAEEVIRIVDGQIVRHSPAGRRASA